MQKYYQAKWMKENILHNHGRLGELYKAHDKNEKGFVVGDFRSEGDSPAFFHTIPTGLRSLESPDWGGWGGRYIKVRENTWLDPVPVTDYEYPPGRWYGSNGWGRSSLREGTQTTEEQRKTYFKPLWRWTDALQNDFAARADWCVSTFEEANHPPVVRLSHESDLILKSKEKITLDASKSSDPDGDVLNYNWWYYNEASSYKGAIEINGNSMSKANLTIPEDADSGDTIHIICEVTDNGLPQLTRYQRIVITVE